MLMKLHITLELPCRFLRPTDCVVPLARAATNKYSYERRRRRRKGKRKGRLPNIHPCARPSGDGSTSTNWAAAARAQVDTLQI